MCRSETSRKTTDTLGALKTSEKTTDTLGALKTSEKRLTSWETCIERTGISKASARRLMSWHRARWQPLRSHHASCESQTSCVVQWRPTSMTRLQKESLARAMPPEHTMKSRWVLTSRLKPLMYAW